ncbi:dihydrodipicolinate reductase C-terminal domain-containing protein [Candidatus Vidania fulgoroideorum]
MRKINIIGASGNVGKLLIYMLKKKGIKTDGYDRLHKVIKKKKEIKKYKREKINVDFSNSRNIPSLIKLLYKGRSYLIIGTTGLSKKENANIRKLSRKNVIFISNNFNLGFNVFIRILGIVKKIIPYRYHLIETHHRYKKDIPSGSSRIIEKILKGINISSVRYGNIIGKHKVIFCNKSNTINITHNSEDRRCFIKIIPYIIKYIISKKRGLFTFKHEEY